MSSRSWLLASLLVVSGAAGCRTPQSLCNEYFDERNAFEDACGLPLADRDRWCRDEAGLDCGCGVVAEANNPDEIVQDCFRFFRQQSDTCDSPALVDYPAHLPSICDPRGHFRARD